MRSIKRIVLLTALVSLPVFLSAQEPVKRDPGNFKGLSVIGNIRVELYKSDTSQLVIETMGTSPENVITENDGGNLSLRLKTNTQKDARVKIRVYYSHLDQLDVQAQALITSPEVIEGDTIAFTAKSGGKMELKLGLKTLSAEVRQGAILVFTGNVEKQTIEVNSGATYSAYELEARDTYVKAASGGKAKVVARRIIDATATLKGFIGYKGEPVSIYVKTNLGGEIVNFKE
ncbi:MAG TPA: head GIN domain-containing protein [Bacteroidales bacterium]|nr:head GIN domain-containing protein [Bacteroidales bacterium]